SPEDTGHMVSPSDHTLQAGHAGSLLRTPPLSFAAAEVSVSQHSPLILPIKRGMQYTKFRAQITDCGMLTSEPDMVAV
ncbi:MAG: hypothetical protein ACR2PG_02230, partial [Hyphomicrobiaceae bacterium]